MTNLGVYTINPKTESILPKSRIHSGKSIHEEEEERKQHQNEDERTQTGFRNEEATAKFSISVCFPPVFLQMERGGALYTAMNLRGLSPSIMSPDLNNHGGLTNL